MSGFHCPKENSFFFTIPPGNLYIPFTLHLYTFNIGQKYHLMKGMNIGEKIAQTGLFHKGCVKPSC